MGAAAEPAPPAWHAGGFPSACQPATSSMCAADRKDMSMSQAAAAARRRRRSSSSKPYTLTLAYVASNCAASTLAVSSCGR